MMERKLVVVVGPTASGKSALAVALAKRFNGEVVSADSRQVYRGLDIGSGKVTRREMRGVPHHLLDIADPRRTFTAAQYQRRALKVLQGIWRRGHIPILCGGTGFYVRAVVDGITFPNVKPNATLRKRLNRVSTPKLFALLYQKDRTRARTIDRKNRRRLIRALEIVAAKGKVPKLMAHPPFTEVLMVGLRKDTKELRKRIETRLARRLKQGMVREVRELHARGVSWKRLEDFGLEYRHVARHLQGKISKVEMAKAILHDSFAYAKRQMTWWRRDARIVWLENAPEAILLARQFIRG